MKYDYLIAFSFEKGTGTVFATKVRKIKSKENIEEVERIIKEKDNLESVAITNFQIIRRYWR